MTGNSVAGADIRSASPTDLSAIEDLLAQSDLPVQGAHELLASFVVAERDGKLAGVAGLERCGKYGLLRSAAVDRAWRGRGLGRALIEKVIANAESDGLDALYLLTTTAAGYFPLFGFETTTRDSAPPEVQKTAEFRDLCPSSATVMRLQLDKGSSTTARR